MEDLLLKKSDNQRNQIQTKKKIPKYNHIHFYIKHIAFVTGEDILKL